ncbi:hypothetical protein F5X96DRAFT_632140 [Biscogniauxia mediterranea]|nr:hypothetical protein F5X96DRAFT_632140 [Biscogniauxia mediterranea]
MSTSPSGGPNGQRPTPPSGAPPLRRPRNTGNPLVPRKKPIQRPPPAKAIPPTKGAPSANAIRPGIKPQPRPAQATNGPANFDHLRRQNGGWSMPKPPDAQDYPLYITKKSLKEGLRFHIMRFASSARGPQQGDIDPTDQTKFARPVTLHRRDPRQPPPGREVKEEVVEQPVANTEEDEKLAQIKAEREAQRAIDDAQKAPVVKDANPKKQPKKEKKPGMQVHYQARTEQQKKEAEIRYEEALPWHLEDADGKNVWVGQYEAPLSDSKVALMIHNGGFRMVPLEKWYKFTSKRGAFQALSIEEAEKIMSKNAALGRWAIRDADREKAERAMEESRKIINGRAAVKQESNTFQQASRREKMEHDDIDMSGDEFQDDDETAGFEPDRDEDTKDSKERVRREQLGANLFGDADEQKVEKEEADLKKEEELTKLLGKHVKKALRHDKQFQYDSDSSMDRDPFASSSESESESDDEDKKDEDKKGDKDKDKDKDKEKDKEKEKEKDKNAASGTAPKGATTPQGKKAAAEAAKKGKSLKRPGSPMVSDSSGTESTRKKKKKTGPSSSIPGSRGGTPLPQRVRPTAGSTSDGEATAGDMSDGAGGKKKHLPSHTIPSKGTPAGSRAGSPVPPQGSSITGPRANSPVQGSSNVITPQEIVDALPPLPGGVTIGGLLKVFQDRIDKPGCMSRKDWIKLVKENANFNSAEKLLRRKS